MRYRDPEKWRASSRKYFWSHREKERQRRAAQYAAELRLAQDLRREVVDAYGGECVCCGEAEPMFLTIDHVNGRDRTNHHAWGPTLYRALKKAGFPKDNYRLLCMNCNWARGRYSFCPHRPGDRQHHPRLRACQ